LIRLAVRCPAERAEQVLAELLALAPGGVEQVDAPDGLQGTVEYAVYGARGELPELGALDAVAGAGPIEVRAEEVPDDWTERWKRFYFPVLVAGRLYVRPPWEEPAQRGGVEEVVIDPGGAFGTGTHATTRMCLELLVETAARGSFCDLGCGSGVLAIAAAKLGFEPVLGVDADRAALAETGRNARANGVELEVRHVDLRRAAAPVADVAAANLTAGLCEAVARSWASAGARPRTAIVSGFLRAEAAGVAAALAAAGLAERRRVVGGEWAAILAGSAI
jgi:ribosomal protein L11 methyltransferase